MRIGLIDGDLSPHAEKVFNIDLMKIYSYYWKERDIPSLFLPDKEESTKFSKVYYRRDFPISAVEENIISIPEIDIGGEAFNIPLIPNGDFEKQIPNTQLYRRYCERVSNKIPELEQKKFKRYLNSSHIKVYNSVGCIKNFEKAILPHSRTAFIHDKGFFLHDDWEDYFKEITATTLIRPRAAVFKLPQIIPNLQTFEKVNSLKLYNGNAFIINAECSNDMFKSIIDMTQKNNQYRIMFCAPTKIIRDKKEAEELITKLLIRVIFCRSLRYNFILKVDDKKSFGPYRTMLHMLEQWSRRAYIFNLDQLQVKAVRRIKTDIDAKTFEEFCQKNLTDYDFNLVKEVIDSSPKLCLYSNIRWTSYIKSNFLYGGT